MTEHQTYVQLIHDAGGAFAVCRLCGADEFRDRRTVAEAQADAVSHGQLVHVYTPEALADHVARYEVVS